MKTHVWGEKKRCLPTVLFGYFEVDNIGTFIWINVQKKKKVL